ncbi:PAS domain-containing protein [Nostoc sp.]|uniref:PAS domain-containing protein n=1 Tax=Nostoc sp. TaxID=1180 RepID=UPI002FF82FFB
MQKTEERWHLAIAGTNEAIWDWDISTNQTFRSELWFTMLGYEPNEISNSDDEWSIRIHPDDYTRVMAAQEAYLLQQVSDYNVEYRLRCKNGSYRWFRSRAKAIWNQQGNPVRLVGSIADINDVSDALKYAFAGNQRGEIQVKFYQASESTLTLIIRDNGIGLPENFDSKKAKMLGITLVQGLVKQLRGKLEINSQQGTEFKIIFTNSRA